MSMFRKVIDFIFNHVNDDLTRISMWVTGILATFLNIKLLLEYLSIPERIPPYTSIGLSIKLVIGCFIVMRILEVLFKSIKMPINTANYIVKGAYLLLIVNIVVYAMLWHVYTSVLC